MATYQAKVSYDWEHRKPWTRIPFPEEEYGRRLAAVNGVMAVHSLDALLIFGAPGDNGSVRWLSNFDAFSGETLLVVLSNEIPWLFTNWVLHGEPMHSLFWQTWFREAHPAAPGPGPAQRAAELLARKSGLHRIGLAGWNQVPSVWMEALREKLPNTEFESADGLLLMLRAIKSPLEIATIRRASQIAGQAMQIAMDSCRPGVTEHQVAAAAHQVIFALGAEDLAFTTAVASGPRAGLKHCGPTERVLQQGDMVFLDLGAKLHGYYSDLSRTLVVGEADAFQLQFLQAAEHMFQVWIRHAQPGSAVRDLQKMCEEIAVGAGFAAEYMPLGYGHGLGTALFELPSLAYGGDQILENGMTFALEPMLVKLGVGTAVMEDTMLVTEDGLEVLSNQPVALYL